LGYDVKTQDFEKLTEYGKLFSGLTPDKEALLVKAEAINMTLNNKRLFTRIADTFGDVKQTVSK